MSNKCGLYSLIIILIKDQHFTWNILHCIFCRKQRFTTLLFADLETVQKLNHKLQLHSPVGCQLYEVYDSLMFHFQRTISLCSGFILQFRYREIEPVPLKILISTKSLVNGVNS